MLTGNVRIYNITTKGSRYRVRWSVAGIQKERVFGNNLEAEGYVEALRKALYTGVLFNCDTGLPETWENAAQSVTEACDAYMEHECLGLSPRTRTETRRFLNHFCEYYGDKDVKTITRQDVNRYLTEKCVIDGQLSSKATLAKYKIPKRVFTYLIREETIDVNPFDNLHKIFTIRGAKAKPVKTVLSETQVMETIEHLPEAMKLLVLTQYYTGMRTQEICVLQPSCVNQNTITIHQAVGQASAAEGGKHLKPLKWREKGDTRTMPAPVWLTKQLSDITTRWCFPNNNNDYPETRTINKLYRKHGIPFTAYDLRHARISEWLEKGVPAPTVAEWAGNSVEVIMTTYAGIIAGQNHRNLLDY